jgi:hypothetical protein
MNDFENLSSALAILSAMLTPALLISACGSLTISITHRFGRTVDRTRKLLEEYEAICAITDNGKAMLNERRAMLYDQLNSAARRTRMLQNSLTGMHLSIGVFVATSVAIGLEVILGRDYAWLPLSMGMIGAGLLFYSIMVLVVEARLTQNAINEEMDFTLRVSREQAPKELLERQRKKRFVLR